jgi:hypothetical protein
MGNACIYARKHASPLSPYLTVFRRLSKLDPVPRILGQQPGQLLQLAKREWEVLEEASQAHGRLLLVLLGWHVSLTYALIHYVMVKVDQTAQTAQQVLQVHSKPGPRAATDACHCHDLCVCQASSRSCDAAHRQLHQFRCVLLEFAFDDLEQVGDGLSDGCAWEKDVCAQEVVHRGPQGKRRTHFCLPQNRRRSE